MPKKSAQVLHKRPDYFLDFDVKHTLEEKVANFRLYFRSLFQFFEKGIA